MAAESSSRETGKDRIESMIDDLIRDILSESGVSQESSARGRATTAALLDRALGSARGGTSRTATLERILVAEAFASELADALAPALAEQIAPRLLKSLEQLIADEAARKPGSSGRSGGQGRKTEGR